MRSKLSARFLTIILFISMVLNLISIPVSADTSSVEVSSGRFMTDKIHVSDGTIIQNSYGDAVISLDGDFTSINMDITATNVPTGANSLCLVLENDSLCEALSLEYIYKDSDGALKNGSTTADIKKGEGEESYIIPVERPENITSLKITFNAAASGRIALISLSAVSYYTDGGEYVGAITQSKYDPETLNAVVSGTLTWETVSANNGARVVLYKLSQGSGAETVAAADEYIAECAISLDFSLSFKLSGDLDVGCGFYAAVLTRDGGLLPIAPEIYLSCSAPSENGQSVGFKGMETSMYAGAIEGESSVAVVDVYLERLLSDNENGLQYILDGKEYYLSSEYISELDARLYAYSAARVDVYLRFLLGKGGYKDLFEITDAFDRAEYYSINVNNAETVARLHVYTDYILNRYKDKNIRGIILGRAIDEAYKYNYCAVDMPLNEYSERIARTCVIIKNIIDENGGGIDLVLPFSDKKFNDPRADAVSYTKNDYASELLLASALEYLSQFGASSDGFEFMVESSFSPIKNIVSDGSNSMPEGKPGERSRSIATDTYAGVLHCFDFSRLLDRLSEYYGELSNEIMFCWYPDGDSITDNYIYNYSIAANINQVRSFIVSSTELDEGVSEKAFISAIKSTYEYMDTSAHAKISKSALDRLGISSFRDVMDYYAEKNLERRTLYSEEFKHSVPDTIIGSYKLWNFASSGGNLGWNSLYGCQTVSVYTPSPSIPRSLVARMTDLGDDAFGAEYGNIIYTKNDLLNVGSLSGISFDVFIPEGESEMIYEVVITVSSGSATVESSGVVFSGVDTVIYADIENIDEIEFIKVSTRNLDSYENGEGYYDLCIKNISIHSTKYDDRTLERMVLAGEFSDDVAANIGGENYRSLMIVSIFSGAAIFLVVLVWIFYKIFRKIYYK